MPPEAPESVGNNAEDIIVNYLCQLFEKLTEDSIGDVIATSFKTNQLTVDICDRLGEMYGVQWRTWL